MRRWQLILWPVMFWSTIAFAQTAIVGPDEAEPGTQVKLKADTPAVHQSWALFPPSPHHHIDTGNPSLLIYSTPATDHEQAFLLASGSEPVTIRVVDLLGQLAIIITGGGADLDVQTHTVRVESPLPLPVLSLSLPDKIEEGKSSAGIVVNDAFTELLEVAILANNSRLSAPRNVLTPPGRFTVSAPDNEVEDGDAVVTVMATARGVTVTKQITVTDDDGGPGPVEKLAGVIIYDMEEPDQQDYAWYTIMYGSRLNDLIGDDDLWQPIHIRAEGSPSWIREMIRQVSGGLKQPHLFLYDYARREQDADAIVWHGPLAKDVDEVEATVKEFLP